VRRLLRHAGGVAAGGQRAAGPSAGILARLLVGRGPPVHVLRAERDQPGLPVQVARAGARRDTRARRPVRRQRLRGGRQHPRHGLPQDAAARAGRRHEQPADLLRDQGERQPGPGGGAGGRRDHVGPAGHRVAAQRGAPADGQGHPGVAERPAAQVGPRAGAPAVLVDPVGLPRREGRLVRGHGRVAARPGAPAAAGGHAPVRYDRYSVYHEQASQQGLILFPIGTLSLVYPAGPGDLDALAYFFTTEPNSGPLRIIQTLHEAVTANPGIRAVTRAVRDWAAAHRSGELPVLTMEDRAGVLEITDTRACARTSRQLLTGLSRAVLLACDSAPRPARLAEIV